VWGKVVEVIVGSLFVVSLGFSLRRGRNFPLGSVDAQKHNIGYLTCKWLQMPYDYYLTISNNILIGGTPGETCVTMTKKNNSYALHAYELAEMSPTIYLRLKYFGMINQI
jgi:hypothetical protein